MTCRRIVMNYTVPPSIEDLEALSEAVMNSLPDELMCHCEDLAFTIEDMVDETVQCDLGLDDPFELLALYKSGNTISPGVEKKVADEDDVLIIYRRSVLDMWSETEEDLQLLLRQVIIEELGRYFEFLEEDIREMIDRPY